MTRERLSESFIALNSGGFSVWEGDCRWYSLSRRVLRPQVLYLPSDSESGGDQERSFN